MLGPTKEMVNARRIAELEAEVETWKEEYAVACNTIAKMHVATIGKVGDPIRGVVEDVKDLRTRFEQLQEENDRLRPIVSKLLD